MADDHGSVGIIDGDGSGFFLYPHCRCSMSTGAQQLQTDFDKVRILLEQYPNISLLQTDGEPPDQYDIEYNLKGYTANPDGTVSPADRHRVRISLPFGYPHLAPTVKPLSPIFHPDIDPDAFRITDFWGKSQSLPGLIIHIGQMICGAIFSTDEPFNQRAFDWYEDHRSLLPFDTLAPLDHGNAEDTETAGAEPSPSEGDSLRPVLYPAPDAESRSAAQDGAPSPADAAQEDDLFFALEMEPREEAPFDMDGEVEDWTAFQGDGEASASGQVDLTEPETAEEDLPTEPADAIDDIFELDFEPPAGQTGAHEPEAAVDVEEWDAASMFNPEPEVPEQSAAAGNGTVPESEDQEISLEPAVDASPAQADQVADREPSVEHPEASAEEKGGLETFALKLDEDPARRFGGEARSIRPLIEHKEIFTAKKVLADISNPAEIAEFEEYRQTIAAAVSEAEELYKKADKHEQNGELEKAGIFLDLVANIAIDYPGLELARNRIREALMAQGQKKAPSLPQAADRPAPKNGQERKNGEELPPVRKIRRPATVKLPYRLIAVVLALVVVCAGGALLYSRDSGNMQLARSEFEKGRQHVNNKDFKPAQQAFAAARTALNNVLLLHRGAKSDLQGQIDAVINSQTFTEGLQGRVLIDGRYISVETAKAVDQFKQLTESAEQYIKAGKLDRAVEFYEKSLAFTEPAGFQEQEQPIRQAIHDLQIRQMIDRGEKAEEAGNWNEAVASYMQARQLDSDYSSPDEQRNITFRLATAEFRLALNEGRRAYAASDWQSSVDSLQRAEKVLAENPSIAAGKEQMELRTMLINSRLFHLLSFARRAYEQQQWDQAVTGYENAITLLNENGAILGAEEAADSRRKIERTVLMTRIAREQSRIEAALGSGDQETALGHYRTIIGLIDRSSFGDDEGLRKIRANAGNRADALKEELTINSRTAWLTQNFEQIFREHYPSARLSELSLPSAAFVKQEGNIMIFTLSCTEKQQGRTFRLQLNYQYDMDTDTWKIYSEKL